MNCNGFEAVTNDLAKEVLMEASQREEALSHAASCERCERRLKDERELTAGLRKLATIWSAEPSAQVEASLLVAFKKQRTEFVGIVASPRKMRRSMYIAAGIAALVIIALMLSMTVSRTRGTGESPKVETAATTTPPVVNQQEPTPNPNPSAVPERLTASRPPDVRVGSGHQNRGRQQRSLTHDELATEAEIATEFFPLNRGGIDPLDSAQVVRVELPRSAMMSFGLPINMDRADERIKADVVVGNDGMARAIRFVR